jgi:glycosyltransferase involved in cell wall biosynthesis
VFENEIATYGGMPWQPFKDPIRDRLEFEFEIADRIIVYSRYAKETMIRHGVLADKIDVVPLPTHTKPKTVDQVGPILCNPARLLYVGRCSADKGLDLATAVAHALGMQLRVAGPASPEIRHWMNAQRDLTYLGILSKPDLFREMRSARCLLMPSMESYGLAVFEAAALGVPVVVSTMTGAGEYISEPNCTVVAGRSIESWATAIESVQRQETIEPFLGVPARAVIGSLMETYSRAMAEQ